MGRRDQVRRQNPGKGKAADYGNSLRAAVDLKCLDCAGSRNEVKLCTVSSCPLWRFRPYAADEERVRAAGVVPTLEEYDRLIGERTTEGGTEALKAWRERQDEAAEQAEIEARGGLL